MNKTLFWSGLGFIIFEFALGIVFGAFALLASIDWTLNLIIGSLFVISNVVALALMLIGALMEDK